MSQLGMNLPGQAGSRKPQMNVYTGLMFLAVVCLGAACFMVYQSAVTVAPGKGPAGAFELQPENASAGQIQLPNAP